MVACKLTTLLLTAPITSWAHTDYLSRRIRLIVTLAAGGDGENIAGITVLLPGLQPVCEADVPMLQRLNTLATPHLGYVTRETLIYHCEDAMAQMMVFCAGAAIHVVNPEVSRRAGPMA
jgi:D-3-phosphoglycerate dehydrogenase